MAINNSDPIRSNSICLLSFWHQSVSHPRPVEAEPALAGSTWAWVQRVRWSTIIESTMAARFDLVAWSAGGKRNGSDWKAERQRAEQFNNAPKWSTLLSVGSFDLQYNRGEVGLRHPSSTHAVSWRFRLSWRVASQMQHVGWEKKLEIRAPFRRHYDVGSGLACFTGSVPNLAWLSRSLIPAGGMLSRHVHETWET